MDPNEEHASLERVAGDSWYARDGANASTIHHCARIFARHWRGERCLELGPAEGLMTSLISAAFNDLTVVEGSERFCEDLKQRFPRVSVVHSLFEEYRPTRPFDTIVLGHVLEHVAAPRELLALVRTWLAPRGAVLAAVPNARSLHRQAAVLMGLLPTEHSLSDADHHHGHRRIYDPESFRAEFAGAGLQIEVFGGYWLKPLSNAQIDATWSPAMLDAFMTLGERYPDVAAEIYVVAHAR